MIFTALYKSERWGYLFALRCSTKQYVQGVLIHSYSIKIESKLFIVRKHTKHIQLRD